MPTTRALLVDDLGVLTAHPSLAPVVTRARAAGVLTAVVSNADGPPRPGLSDLTDVTVLSGETGLRKPDPAIFALAAARLGVLPQHCVFVDDLAANVRGAVAAGMVGVHHTDFSRTVDELEILLGVRLREWSHDGSTQPP